MSAARIRIVGGGRTGSRLGLIYEQVRGRAVVAGATLISADDRSVRFMVRSVEQSGTPGGPRMALDLGPSTGPPPAPGTEFFIVDTRRLRAAVDSYIAVHRDDPYPGDCSTQGLAAIETTLQHEHSGTRLEEHLLALIDRVRNTPPSRRHSFPWALRVESLLFDGYAAQNVADEPFPPFDITDWWRTDDPHRVAVRMVYSDGSAAHGLFVRSPGDPEGKGASSIEVWNTEPPDLLQCGMYTRDRLASLGEWRGLWRRASGFLDAVTRDEPWTRQVVPPDFQISAPTNLGAGSP